jgi:predicted alpha/beta-hydrolase family hydrolase
MTPDDFLFDGPVAAKTTLVLAHGAGAAMDSPFMAAVADGLGAGGVRVARFEFPYMRGRRESGSRRPPDREAVLLQTWREAVAALGGGANVAIGGKSMGGRMASMVADELGVRALVCLGYPFHAPGRADKPRVAHLTGLRTPALIVQGTRDPFGGREEVEGYGLSAAVRVHWLEDGDHDFKPRAASGSTPRQNRDEAIAVVLEFLASILR